MKSVMSCGYVGELLWREGCPLNPVARRGVCFHQGRAERLRRYASGACGGSSPLRPHGDTASPTEKSCGDAGFAGARARNGVAVQRACI